MDNEALLSLASRLGEVLKRKGLTLTLAESCTGGMVSQFVTAIVGSSSWFDRGFVTYSNQAKIEMLDVSSVTIQRFGAVSEQTAAEMALGALKKSRAQLAGSITGIAGPDGGTPDKPVGTVCFSWAGLEIPQKSITLSLNGLRHEIRQQATSIMIKGLIDRVNQPNI